jgi:hypothetical protein
MNVMSDQQKRQLLFAPTNNKYRKNEWLEQTKTFDIVTERFKQINRNNFGPLEVDDGGNGEEIDTVMGGEYWDGFLPAEEREARLLRDGSSEGVEGYEADEPEVIMNGEDIGEPISLTEAEQEAIALMEQQAEAARVEMEEKKGKKRKGAKEKEVKVKKEKKHTQFEIKGLGLLPVEYTKVSHCILE